MQGGVNFGFLVSEYDFTIIFHIRVYYISLSW